MRGSGDGPAPRRGERLRRRLAVLARGERGFALIESLVSLAIIAVVMSALGAFFVTVTQGTNHARLSQLAAQTADSAIESVRAIGDTTHEGAANTIVGRGQAKVTAQFATTYSGCTGCAAGLSANGKVKPLLDSMQPWWDNANPNSGDSATLPTKPVARTVEHRSFAVNYYVGLCYRPVANKAGECGPINPGTGVVTYVRVVVAVAWTDPSCPKSGCATVSATLLNGDVDPIFNIVTQPPPGPTVKTIPTQKDNAGDVVNGLALAAADCAASPCPPNVPSGVLPLTFSATGLPDGLVINPATGVITGTVSDGPEACSGSPASVTQAGPPAVCSVQISVTDAFLRSTTSAAFDWDVYGPIEISPSPVPNQASQAGVALPAPIDFTATGGSGTANLSWSASGLPTGITKSAPSPGVARLNGTPAAGTYTVTLTVKDSVTGSSHQVSFRWVVGTLVLTTPRDRTATIGAPDSVALTAVGPAGTYAWSVVSMVDANGQSPTDLPTISGTGPSATLTWDSPGVGVYAVTVQVSVGGNTAQTSFTWSAYSPPTWTSTPAANQKLDVGLPLSLPFGYDCPSQDCTFRVSTVPSPTPAWLTTSPRATTRESGSVSLTSNGGGVTSSGTWTVTYSIVQGNASVSTTVGLTVFDQPTVTAPHSSIVTAPGTTDTEHFAVACPNAPCSLHLSADQILPSWISLDPNGLVTVQAPSGTYAHFSHFQVVATDAAGVDSPPAPVDWWVDTPPTVTAPATQTVYAGSPLTITPKWTCTAQPCSYSPGTLPSWLAWNSTTHAVSAASVPASAVGSPVTVAFQIIDGAGYSNTQSTTITVDPALTISASPAVVRIPVGASTTQTLTAAGGGGTGSYTWALKSGSLPAGVSLPTNTSTDTLSLTGAPTAAGVYTFTVQVTSSALADVSQTITVTWYVGVWVQVPDQNTEYGSSINVPVQFNCPTTSCTFALTGQPAWLGLRYSTNSGTSYSPIGSTTSVPSGAAVYLYGTPTSSDDTIAITITSTSGTTATDDFAWDVWAKIRNTSTSGYAYGTGSGVTSSNTSPTAANYRFQLNADRTISVLGDTSHSPAYCLQSNGNNSNVTVAACNASKAVQLWSWSNGHLTTTVSGSTYYLRDVGSGSTLQTAGSSSNSITWALS